MALGRYEGPRLRVVVDTNVWVSALIVPDSPPGRVLEAALRGKIEPVASWELIEEIVAVLRRPRLRRYEIAEDDVEELLTVLAPFLPSVDVEPPIRDPGDAPIVAAALAGGAELIVTGDNDFLDDYDLGRWLGERGVRVVRPAALIELLAR